MKTRKTIQQRMALATVMLLLLANGMSVSAAEDTFRDETNISEEEVFAQDITTTTDEEFSQEDAVESATDLTEEAFNENAVDLIENVSTKAASEGTTSDILDEISQRGASGQFLSLTGGMTVWPGNEAILNPQKSARQYCKVTVNASTLTSKTPTEIQYNLQRIFDIAGAYATESCPYMIVIPAGTYSIGDSLHIYSNTYLYMKNVTLQRCFENGTGCMLRTGRTNVNYTLANNIQNQDKTRSGYNGYKNIYLYGGNWDGNASDSVYGMKAKTHPSKAFSQLRFGHGANVVLDHVTITDNGNSHHVEFGGIDTVTVKNCKFSGQVNVKNPDGTYNGNEALQIDVVHSDDVFSDFAPYDDTVTKNVSVSDCTFENVFRGAGSHSGVLGKYYTNVNITHNTFKNINQQAIVASNYKSAKITDNTMTNAGAGIEFKYMTSEGTSFYVPNSGSYELKPDCATEIANNKITTCKTKEYDTPEGIRIMGWNLTNRKDKEHAPKGTYYISNVNVHNNTITTNCYGMRIIQTRNSIFRDNTITIKKDANGVLLSTVTNDEGKKSAPEALSLAQSSTGNTLRKNTITNAVGIGVLLTSKSTGNTISENTITNAKTVGIQVYNNSSATLKSNTLTSKMSDTGIMISTNSTATVAKNKLTEPAGDGIKIYNKSSGTIKNNTVTSSSGNGIAISKESKQVTVTGNTIKKAKKSGISVYDSSTEKIVINGTNKISDSGDKGILVNTKSTATIEKNEISNSGTNGIALIGGAKKCKVNSNTIKTTKKSHGIQVTDSTGDTISQNTLTGIKGTGIQLSKASATVTSNTITSPSAEGIKYEKKSSGTIKNNAVKKGGSNGIAVCNESSQVTVEANKVSDSKKSGISVYGDKTKDVTIKKNTLTSNKEHGLLVNKNTSAKVQDNTIKKSGKNGIMVASAKGTVTLSGNTISDCKAHGIGATGTTVKINSNKIKNNKKYGISLSDKGTVKEMKKNSLSNKGIREIYVAFNVKSPVKNLDAVKINEVKAKAKKITGKATPKTSLTAKANGKTIKTAKNIKKANYSLKIKGQPKGTTLTVESKDKYGNVAYRSTTVK